MAKRYHGKDLGDYSSGLAARNRMESEHGGMIRENHSAIANLPQEVMIKPYPETGPYMPENLDDTIRGADHQIDVLDDGMRRRHNVAKKV